MKMKRLIALLMAATMILSSLAVTSFAEDTQEADGTIYPYGTYEPSSFEVSGGSGRVTIECERVHLTSRVYAEISFSSTKYTKVTVGEKVYEPIVDMDAGKSFFRIPVKPNTATEITGTTVAMGGNETDVKYTITVGVDKENLKPVARKALKDGFYTTTVSSDRLSYGYKTDKEGNVTQIGINYPDNDYELPVTIQVKDGKIVNVAYTKDPNEVMSMMNTSSDFNYLLWAMDGHNVTDSSYNYLNKAGKNYDTYHLDPHPVKNGTGMRDQIIAKSDITGVDTVTAATLTSRAIIDSVDQSLTKAEYGLKDDPNPELPGEDTSKDIIPADGYYIAKLSNKKQVVGATLGKDNQILLNVKDGKITAELLYIEQDPSSYSHIYNGKEAEALEVGEAGWLKPDKYDYGYFTSKGVFKAGSIYKDVPMKSLDKSNHFVMFASGSGNWFNRLIRINTADIRKITAAERNLLLSNADFEVAEVEYMEILAKADATAEEVKAAQDKVLEATADLTGKVKAASGIYTAASCKAVTDAVAAFDAAIAKTDLTQAELSETKVAIDDAVAGLTAKQAQKLTVKAVKKTLKVKNLKKKAASYKAVKVSGNKGKVSYSAKALGKSKKALKFKNGKITVKKGTKKGTYKMTVTVKAAATDDYKAASKKVTVSVKVK